MGLTEQQFIDRIEVVGEFRQVQIREATIVYRDGEEVSRTFHRRTLSPGADVSGEPAPVQSICSALWTQDIVDAYNAHLTAGSEL